ncbi:MAG: FtsX-like permease family protein, partial [Chloroflexi bacterium]|nr:FtsX-like permease family protein [Chloroflexota bacterium]
MKRLLTFLRPRWRKVMADLWDSKTRTILVVASIAVGVFAIGAIVTAFVIMSEEIDHSYITVNPANIGVATRPFGDELVSSIEKEPELADVEGQYLGNFRVSKDGETWETFTLVAKDDYDNQIINKVQLLEGSWLQDDRQIMIGYDTMRDPGFRVGDVAYIEVANGNIREIPVVGLIRDQSTAGDFTALNRGYISMDMLNWLGEPEQFNRLFATVAENKGDADVIEEMATAIEDKMQRGGLPVFQTIRIETDEHPMGSIILALLGVLGALGILVMLLSSSLIVNTLNALLAQHLRQIGVMKLIGGRSAQISLMYILLILAYGLIALLISVPLGALAGYGLSAFIADFMSANLSPFRIVPVAIVIQIAIAFIVPLAAGFFPVNRGSKIKVRRAISNDSLADQSANSAFLDGLGRWMKWVSRPLLLSIRNTFRRKGRLALTLFTLTMAGAIFIAVFNVRDSMDDFMDMLSQHFLADITLTFDQPYRDAKVEQSIYQLSGVSHVEGWLAATGDIMDSDDNAEESIAIIAPPVKTELLDPDMVAGRWLQPSDHKGIVLADTIWDDYPDLQPGDTIPLQIQDGRTEEWEVLGMFRFIGMVGVNFAYTDYDTMADILGSPGQSFSYRVVSTDQTLKGQQL